MYHRSTMDREWRCGKCGAEFTTVEFEAQQARLRAEREEQQQQNRRDISQRIAEEKRLFAIASYEWDKQLKETFGERKVERERLRKNPDFCPPDFHIYTGNDERGDWRSKRITWLWGHTLPMGGKGRKLAEELLKDAEERTRRERNPKPKKRWPFG